METTQRDESIAELQLHEPEEGVFETYSNLVDADWTLTDVTIRFMQLMHVGAEKNPTMHNREGVVLERANVTLPWLQAKHLVHTLGRLVVAYESVNGELKMPELAKLTKE